jgi:hypothetical protein
MTNSNLSKKVLIPAVIVAVAVGLSTWGLSPAIAAVNQAINTGAPGYQQIPKITGSVSAAPTLQNFTNLKVSFLQASEIAAKQIANGTVVGGHIGVVQGYLVYTFFALNAQSKTGYLTIVDAGNGKVLYTSQGLPMGSLGQPTIGPFGRGGMQGFGGFSHGPFGGGGMQGFGGGGMQGFGGGMWR